MSNCHSMLDSLKIQGGCIALVGNPNVGKSILFHRLTGKYVVVSNYPGTTVELTQGALRAVKGITLLDTPGIINLPSRSEDEQVTERVLFQGGLQAVVQVGDAKNIRRTLHLTIWLAEMNLPLVLALNMMDEASSRGLNINIERLKEKLSIPVVKTIATRGAGISDLEEAVRRAETPRIRIEYPEQIERALEECEPYLPAGAISSRALGLLWLCEDVVSEQYVKEKLNPQTIQILMEIRRALQNRLEDSPTVIIQQARERYVDQLADLALDEGKHRKLGLGDLLGRLSVHPVWGIPVLGLVLYGMYWFVGVFGAGTLVGLIEEDFFGGIINPWLISLAERFIPWPLARDLLVGDYGLWSMGLTYALALLLPIVFTFFIAFGVLEDSGYLPRLAVLTNRLFSAIGLNGQAVLPMVLGLGCVTMATMTTRILTRPREKILVTLLLALAIPCSAQLGVVLGMLAAISFNAAIIWGGVVLLILFAVGWLAARLIPGERSPLIVELPPLRLPVLSNVFYKTLARVEWYVKEAVPLFLAGTLLLFLLDTLNALPALILSIEPIVTGWLGLPPQASEAFILGLMRRDFAATGLFVMQLEGNLTALQALVSITTITLFIPCIAAVFMIIKERGRKTALGMTVFIFPFSIFVGGLLQRFLTWVGWGG